MGSSTINRGLFSWGGGPASADRKRWMLFWHLCDNGLRDGFKQAKTDKRNTRTLG